jgi:hypothetical protein
MRASLGARQREINMRKLSTSELSAVAGGVNPHLIAVNPGGQSNKSTEKNPNTTVIKTTGKWN